MHNKFMLKIARFITFILHPMVLVSPAVFLIVIASGGGYYEAFLWTIVTLLFTLFVAGYILLGVKKGFFSNFDVSKRKQRIYLFPFVIATALIFLAVLFNFNGPKALLMAILYFVIALAILTVVNLRVKASIHVASLTAALVSASYLFGVLFYPFLIFIPVMAWARIIEKRHTLKETIVGFIMGTLLAIMGIIIVQYLI